MENQQLTVILTNGLPGLGKSSLIERLTSLQDSQENTRVRVITSDSVRCKSKTRFCEMHDTSSMDEYEIETKAKGLYDEIFKLCVQEAFEDLKKVENGIFILDKNHVPSNVRELIVEESKESHPKPLLLYIVPRQTNQEDLRISFDGQTTPYFYDTLFCSFARCFKRDSHPTMNFGKAHVCKSIINCLKRFKGMDFEKIAEDTEGEVLYYDFFNSIEAGKESNILSLLSVFENIKSIVDQQDFDDESAQKIHNAVREEIDLDNLFCTFTEQGINEAIDALMAEVMAQIRRHQNSQ